MSKHPQYQCSNLLPDNLVRWNYGLYIIIGIGMAGKIIVIVAVECMTTTGSTYLFTCRTIKLIKLSSISMLDITLVVVENLNVVENDQLSMFAKMLKGSYHNIECNGRVVESWQSNLLSWWLWSGVDTDILKGGGELEIIIACEGCKNFRLRPLFMTMPTKRPRLSTNGSRRASF